VGNVVVLESIALRQYELDNITVETPTGWQQTDLKGERGILVNVSGIYPNQTALVLFSRPFMINGSYRTTSLVVPIWAIGAVI
jgi:hypothetical protein